MRVRQVRDTGKSPGAIDDTGGSPMPLPVRTALADIEAICRYLLARPEGATPVALAAALGDIFDLRKLFALKFWGLVADDGTAVRVTARGRRAVDAGRPGPRERAPGGRGGDAPLCRGDRQRRRAERTGAARLRRRGALAAALQVRLPVRHSQPPDRLLLPGRRRRRARPPSGRPQGTADALRARRSRGPRLRRGNRRILAPRP